jgi:hypothetical protein
MINQLYDSTTAGAKKIHLIVNDMADAYYLSVASEELIHSIIILSDYMVVAIMRYE